MYEIIEELYRQRTGGNLSLLTYLKKTRNRILLLHFKYSLTFREKKIILPKLQEMSLIFPNWKEGVVFQKQKKSLTALVKQVCFRK